MVSLSGSIDFDTQSIDENSETTFPIATIMANDDENDTITLSIDNTADFYLTQTSPGYGQLFANSLDHETNSFKCGC